MDVTRGEGEPIAVTAVVDCPSTLSIPNFAGCEEEHVTLSSACSTGHLGDHTGYGVLTAK
jgi:hypothetical protein